MHRPRDRLFGVVLAGGRSRRYGSPKARARLAGLTLLERALGILRAAGLEAGVVVANRTKGPPPPGVVGARARVDDTRTDVVGARARVDGARPGGPGDPAAPPGPGPGPGPGLPGGPGHPSAIPARADLVPGAGPLGGLHTALSWARERGNPGVFLLGCDMPLVPPVLVRRLAGRFHPARPTVPASPGPLGMEPLCACYPVGLEAAVEESLAAGRFGMGEFARAANPVVPALDRLAPAAVLRHAFLNVNTPADRERAALLLGGARATQG